VQNLCSLLVAAHVLIPAQYIRVQVSTKGYSRTVVHSLHLKKVTGRRWL
jgi:hypothetical protein